MKNFVQSHDIKLKDIITGTTGAAVAGVAVASLREQQLRRKELASQNLAQQNRDKLALISRVRRNVKDDLMSGEEALNYCKRENILTEKECLGSASRPTDIEKKKKPTHIDSQYSNKTLRGGGNKKVNSHKKTSKDNQTDALFDSETQEWINSSEDNSFSNGLTLETSDFNDTTPTSQMAEVAVSAYPPVNSEFKNNEVRVLPASAPFIAGVIFMVLYGFFVQIKKKNTRIKNFFATDTEKILENQAKMQEKLDEIYSGQQEIRKKLGN
jgi:hypothetical protein